MINTRNVYIIGAQSTGKTTLVKAFETHFAQLATGTSSFRPVIIHEVAREVLKTNEHLRRKDLATSPDCAFQLQDLILAAQYHAEITSCSANASKWYIADRSGLDPIVYAKHFIGEHAAAKLLASDMWSELECRMKAGIVVLCEAGCRWLEDDGVRMMPRDMEEWMSIDAMFRELLQARGIGFCVISRDVVNVQQRVDYLWEKVRKAL